MIAPGSRPSCLDQKPATGTTGIGRLRPARMPAARRGPPQHRGMARQDAKTVPRSLRGCSQDSEHGSVSASASRMRGASAAAGAPVPGDVIGAAGSDGGGGCVGASWPCASRRPRRSRTSRRGRPHQGDDQDLRPQFGAARVGRSVAHSGSSSPLSAGTATSLTDRRSRDLADPTGFEPAISSVTGWHVRPLHHGSCGIGTVAESGRTRRASGASLCSLHHARPHRPALRHRHQAHPGDAPGHGGGRGRRRCLRRRPHRHRAPGACRRADRQGGRPVRRQRHDGQPRVAHGPRCPRRRDRGPQGRTSSSRRGRVDTRSSAAPPSGRCRPAPTAPWTSRPSARRCATPTTSTSHRRRWSMLENTHAPSMGQPLTAAYTASVAAVAHEHRRATPRRRGTPVERGGGSRALRPTSCWPTPTAPPSASPRDWPARSARSSSAAADFIERARRARKLVGGGMRQVGVLAAPGLVALRMGPEGMIERLAEDHANARRLGRWAWRSWTASPSSTRLGSPPTTSSSGCARDRARTRSRHEPTFMTETRQRGVAYIEYSRRPRPRPDALRHRSGRHRARRCWPQGEALRAAGLSAVSGLSDPTEGDEQDHGDCTHSRRHRGSRHSSSRASMPASRPGRATPPASASTPTTVGWPT